MNFRSFQLCVMGVALTSGLSSYPAHAAPALIQTRGSIPALGLENHDPVPANGVLTFSYVDGMMVRVLAADGSEVPGSFIEDGIWRPDEPFTEGSYTVDVEVEPATARAQDGSFEVVAAVDELPELLRVSVTTQVAVAGVLQEVCCGSGEAQVGGAPCVNDCKPLCVPSSYAVKQTVQVAYNIDWENPLVEQAQIDVPAALSPGQFAEGVWDVVPDADGNVPEQLCGVGEVFSWLDETTTTVSRCITNPEPNVDPIHDAVSSFGHITECTTPPEGYDAPWCQAQAYTCEDEVLQLTGAEAERLTAACAKYYTLCDRPNPAPPLPQGSLDASPGGNATSTSDEAAASDEGQAGARQRGVTTRSSGCAVGQSAVGGGPGNLGPRHRLGVILLLAAGVAVRRRGTHRVR